MKTYKNVFTKMLLFFLATILPLFLWNRLQGVDNLYMYAHAKDMLENGLVRTTDIFSMHENFAFSYQKWAACLLTYFIVHNFGWYGLTVATYVLIFLLLLSLYLFSMKFNHNHMLFNTAVIMSCTLLLEANGTLRFRPHVIAGILFVYMFYILEKYANGLIKADWKFYLRFIITSVILMWFHSTMWIMFIIVFLPYLFNFSHIASIFRQREYKIKPLLLSMFFMFAAGIFNPNGLKQYQYMWVCMQASGSAYSHVDELRPMPFAMYFPVLAIGLLMMLFTILHFVGDNVLVYMPSIYLVAGSLVMPLIAWRLVFYSIIFMVVAIIIQTAKYPDQAFNLVLDKKTVSFSVFDLAVTILAIGFISRLEYMSVPDIALANGTREYEIDEAVDMIYKEDSSATVFTTTAHVGSYCIYKGLKPYMDCRAEVYDININKQADILSEIYNLSDDMFHDIDLDNGGFELLDEYYHPDYYVLTRYSGADMNIKKYLEQADADCLYDGDSVWIYSMDH